MVMTSWRWFWITSNDQACGHWFFRSGVVCQTITEMCRKLFRILCWILCSRSRAVLRLHLSTSASLDTFHEIWFSFKELLCQSRPGSPWNFHFNIYPASYWSAQKTNWPLISLLLGSQFVILQITATAQKRETAFISIILVVKPVMI